MATSENWAQDVITCDLCVKPSQQFCNSCQVSLCNVCVHKHREEFQSLSHDVVPFLHRKIQLALPECREHPGHRCEAHCNNCNQPACIKCILSGPHKGHAAEELSKTHESKVQKIIKETQLITTKIIPNYQKKDVEIETTMSEAKLNMITLKKKMLDSSNCGIKKLITSLIGWTLSVNL